MYLSADSTPFSSGAGASGSAAGVTPIFATGRDFISTVVSTSGCCTGMDWTAEGWIPAGWIAAGWIDVGCADGARSAERGGDPAPTDAGGRSTGRGWTAPVVLGETSIGRGWTVAPAAP